MEKIAIVGVSPVGVSMGLALMDRRLGNTEIVITSGDRNIVSQASKLAAANKTTTSMRDAVEDAHLVILDAPVSELREVMDTIGPYVESGAVVTDTSNVKGPVLKWSEELLPQDTNFIGGYPLIKSPPESIEVANAAIFRAARYTITPKDDSDQQSIRTVVGLVEAIGASPVFLDPVEHDSYAAAMHHLPMIMSSAFVTATAGSEGWREMHMLAEAQFNTFGKHASNDPLDNEAVCLANPDSIVHWVDQLILELYNYRNEIKEVDNDGGDALLDRFVKAWEHRAKWEADAVVPRDGAHLPSAGESMMSAMLGEKLAQRLRGAGKDDEESRTTYVRRNR
ncbi:MAG: prephenate dehydrogenase [Dehalococcoidia bacterium]|nr:prephenate dehydrogenase [Dehalococcoidia bacterium]